MFNVINIQINFLCSRSEILERSLYKFYAVFSANKKYLRFNIAINNKSIDVRRLLIISYYFYML